MRFPDQMMDDLREFIDKNYREDLPNSLLIAEAFMLRYPEYGKKYGLSQINETVEYLIKQR
jgi:hypothetical protein